MFYPAWLLFVTLGENGSVPVVFAEVAPTITPLGKARREKLSASTSNLPGTFLSNDHTIFFIYYFFYLFGQDGNTEQQ